MIFRTLLYPFSLLHVQRLAFPEAVYAAPSLFLSFSLFYVLVRGEISIRARGGSENSTIESVNGGTEGI